MSLRRRATLGTHAPLVRAKSWAFARPLGAVGLAAACSLGCVLSAELSNCPRAQDDDASCSRPVERRVPGAPGLASENVETAEQWLERMVASDAWGDDDSEPAAEEPHRKEERQPTRRAPPLAVQPRAWPSNSSEARTLLDDVYEGIDGFALSTEDANMARENGENNGTFRATYGEFTVAGVETLLQELKITGDDVFCDLGSGVGKVVMQALLESAPAEAIGVELSERRHSLADHARTRLLSAVPANAGRVANLHYIHGDMFALGDEVARCSKIFVCSTVMPPALLVRLEQLLLSLPFRRTPVLVASSRELKGLGDLTLQHKAPGARFLRHKMVRTSWGASFISIYALGDAPSG